MRTRLRFGPITLRIGRRGVETSTKVGPYRWGVDRALARLAGYGRLTLRYERSARLFAAFRTLAAMLTYYKKVMMWDKIQYCNGASLTCRVRSHNLGVTHRAAGWTRRRGAGSEASTRKLRCGMARRCISDNWWVAGGRRSE